MITGIAYLEFGVRDLDACRHLLVTGLGLDELGHGTGQDGERVAIIAVGSSLLQLHEHAVAVSELADDGSSRDYLKVPGSIQHISFYTQDNKRNIMMRSQRVLKKLSGADSLEVIPGK